MYARHGQQLGGESPLEEEMVLTPSKQQLRQRELWWEGSWTANLCTEVHEAHIRHVEVGKLARCSEARHRQERRRVDATAVEEKLLLLFGEACTGAAGNGSSHRSKVVADRTGISRGHSTGGDLYRREGPNVMRAWTSSPLVMVATTAANPPLVGLEGE